MHSDPGAWLPPPGGHGNVAQARIIVKAGLFPLAYIYAFITPNITINGSKERRAWGTHTFDVPAGNYEVSVSYPWLFVPECGKNSVRFRIVPGETKTVKYQAGLVRSLPGSIRVI